MNSVSATRTAQIRSTSCLDYTQHRYRKYCLPRQQGRQGHPKRTSRESPAQVAFGALTSLHPWLLPQPFESCQYSKNRFFHVSDFLLVEVLVVFSFG